MLMASNHLFQSADFASSIFLCVSRAPELDMTLTAAWLSVLTFLFSSVIRLLKIAFLKGRSLFLTFKLCKVSGDFLRIFNTH